MILGILPRPYASDCATSKAIGLNGRLADLCTQKGVRFVDPFDEFFGKRNLYLRDGVHLSTSGKNKLGDFLNHHLYSLLRASKNVESTPQQKKGKPSPRVNLQLPKRGPTKEEVSSSESRDASYTGAECPSRMGDDPKLTSHSTPQLLNSEPLDSGPSTSS